MAFKLNISEKGRAWKLEAEAESLVGKSVAENDDLNRNSSYTTAICNQKKECIDVYIHCENGKPVKIEPVSELINMGDEWADTRNSTSLCQ